MSHHAKPPPAVAYVATLPSAQGKVKGVIEIRGKEWTLRVSGAGKTLGAFPVPGHIAAYDLPFWFSSVIRSTVPTVDRQALLIYEDEIRRVFPSGGALISVCVGPRADFHLCHLLHIDRNNISSGCRGTSLAISAPIQGLRLLAESSQANWNIIFQTSSERHAQALEEQMLGPGECLVSVDHNVRGIMAFNRERWECAGISAGKVIKLAARHKISLRQVDSHGPGLAFLVREA